jgi:hypothetical protein
MAQAGMQVHEDSAMAKAAKGLGKIIAVLIILAVAALGDVMYIIEMQRVFPGGLLLAFCYLGAFTSFFAIGYLLLGKSVAFRPGAQMLAAWVVFGAELLIIALNIMLVFSGDRSGPLGIWAMISPATPVFHMLGVALIFFLDPDLKEKHEEMELQARMNRADREYRFALYRSAIDLKYKHLKYTVSALEEAVNSDKSQAFIREHGYRMNAQLLSDLSGRSLPWPSDGQVVDEDGGRSKKK